MDASFLYERNADHRSDILMFKQAFSKCYMYHLLLKSLMFRRLAELRVLLTAARSQLFHRQEGVCKTIRLSRCHE